MCGISGYYGQKKIDRKIVNDLLKNMSVRGPNSQKFIKKKFLFNSYLFHSRLSIIDLKSRSDQPMIGKKYSIIFNGEIYNYQSIREKLINHGYKFSTEGDCEVVLKAYDLWG